MPPKPRPIRKTTSKDVAGTPTAASKDTAPTSASMPPPPDPLPPLGILEAEVTALSSCLQNAVVKTGQVYGFYTDVKRLGLQQYATRPPRSLMSSLGREIVKYDQLCDAVESHLLRAITVLQRDITREEARLKAEEEAAAAALKSSPPSVTTGITPPGSPQSVAPDTLPDGSMRPRMSGIGVRRQSTISLSSLSRPAFPHKLDLSASALRINPEEMMIPSGISSPVTLAPRSALAPSLPPELVMAALGDAANRPVDIDLTVDGDIDMSGAGDSNSQVRGMGSLDPALGTAAKPIDIDLDIDMEFFSNGSGAGAGHADAIMFGSQPVSGPSQHTDMIKPKEEEQQIDMSLLHGFPSSGDGDDLFASLGESASGAVPGTGAPPSTADAQKTPVIAQSPGSILAGFAAAASQGGDATGGAAPDQHFDFDISTLGPNFFGSEPSAGNEVDMMSMDDIFNMEVNPSNEGATNNTTSSS